MCGIAGLFHADADREVASEVLQRMAGLLHHRGPDDAGVYLRGPIGLAARRLAIVDPGGGAQPIGHGPALAAMQAACAALGIAGRFRFVGWVEHDRVADYLNLADVVVMPAEDETQARVYLETQACGRVLLASDIAAAREVIRDGETGVLFRKGEPADLAARLLHLADRPALRADIGGQARARIAAHALPAIVAAYLDALAAVVP
jgi:glycosyltransferase involved in cell wall biosynthesis